MWSCSSWSGPCSDVSLLPSQGVVLQQDTYIEGQKLALSERALSRGFFRPASLLEQEKQRNLEKQRQELANLKKQQAQHQEEKKRAEKECEAREKKLAELEIQLAKREEEIQKGWQELECRRDELRQLKASYQLEMEKLLSKQKQLDKEWEQLKKDMERQPQMWLEHDDNQVNASSRQALTMSCALLGAPSRLPALRHQLPGFSPARGMQGLSLKLALSLHLRSHWSVAAELFLLPCASVWQRHVGRIYWNVWSVAFHIHSTWVWLCGTLRQLRIWSQKQPKCCCLLWHRVALWMSFCLQTVGLSLPPQALSGRDKCCPCSKEARHLQSRRGPKDTCTGVRSFWCRTVQS